GLRCLPRRRSATSLRRPASRGRSSSWSPPAVAAAAPALGADCPAAYRPPPSRSRAAGREARRRWRSPSPVGGRPAPPATAWLPPRLLASRWARQASPLPHLLRLHGLGQLGEDLEHVADHPEIGHLQ